VNNPHHVAKGVKRIARMGTKEGTNVAGKSTRVRCFTRFPRYFKKRKEIKSGRLRRKGARPSPNRFDDMGSTVGFEKNFANGLQT